MKITTIIDLDFAQSGIRPRVFAKQSDANNREITIKCYANGQEIFIANASAQIGALKPDGKKIYADAKIIENQVVFDILNQMLTTPGDVRAEVHLSDTNGTVRSSDFIIAVAPAAVRDTEIKSQDNYESNIKSELRAQASAEAAVAGALLASNSATSAETAKTAAETAKTAAASSASSAASSKTAAETAKTAAEKSAKDAAESAAIATEGNIKEINGKSGEKVTLTAADVGALAKESTAENSLKFNGQVASFYGKAPKTYLATIGTSWSDAAPYTQTISVSGLTARDTPIVDLVLSGGTVAVNLTRTEAWCTVGRIETAANSITVTCYEEKPTVVIPIQLKVVE